MKRRNFVKQSIAGTIIAATPLALTGLVRAEGSGGPGLTTTGTTDWWGTTTTWFIDETTEYDSSDDLAEPEDIEIPEYEPQLPFDPEKELGYYNQRPSDCDGSCTLSGWFKAIVDGKWICWREVTGCEELTFSWIEICPQSEMIEQDPLDTTEIPQSLFGEWCRGRIFKEVPEACKWKSFPTPPGPLPPPPVPVVPIPL